MKLITIYDNNLSDLRLRSGWGFSCFLEHGGERILFDTGGDAPTLLHNMRILGIDPECIDLVILSHAHHDHTGGVSAALRSGIRLFIPASFPESFKAGVRSRGAKIVEVREGCKIGEGLYTTGELGEGIKEQALLGMSKEGIVVITGCAHPGIVNILKYVRREFDERIYLVLGGFHLGNRDVSREFWELGVVKVAPCHCTGDVATAYLRERYRDDFISNGAGSVIEI